jgi:PIN domain nuclease of toxin-antitoxin system
LLDTHIATWLIMDHSLLSAEELHLIRLADNEIALSAISVWELRLKWNSFFVSGERKGPIDPIKALSLFRRLGLPIHDLQSDILAAPLQHPIRHKDPFDELLLVQAQKLGMKLLTRDGDLEGHPLAHFA